MTTRAATLARTAAALRSAGTVAVCSHVDPDGDAVGSTLAATHALLACGVNAVPVLAGGEAAPKTYAFLPGAGLYRTVGSLDAVPDVVLALDAPDPARLGEASGLLADADVVIVMDHHPDNRGYGSVNLADETAPATGTLVWELLPALGVAPTPDIATCLYTALMTDTGRFSYSNATPHAFRTAAELIEHGADPNALYSAVYENRSAGFLALAARVVSRLTVVDGGSIAYSWVDEADLSATSVDPAETENLIDEIRVLGGVAVIALLKVRDGVVKGSLRAKGDADVGAAARALGGGGHRAAAGFTIFGGLDDAVARLLATLRGGA